jgi:hypothetical protein
MAGANVHKPQSLAQRQKNFDESGLNGKSGYKRPGSNKK